mmetsp:Transcript_19967/g.58948  ORF Transcript_19967/g.58948 Transcript_19967/m.58948 type:complete len:207 (+) Transcript_19967:93-713(+)
MTGARRTHRLGSSAASAAWGAGLSFFCRGDLVGVLGPPVGDFGAPPFESGRGEALGDFPVASFFPPLAPPLPSGARTPSSSGSGGGGAFSRMALRPAALTASATVASPSPRTARVFVRRFWLSPGVDAHWLSTTQRAPRVASRSAVWYGPSSCRRSGLFLLSSLPWRRTDSVVKTWSAMSASCSRESEALATAAGSAYASTRESPA